MNKFLFYSLLREIERIKFAKNIFSIYLTFLPFFAFSQNSITNTGENRVVQDHIIVSGDVVIVGGDQMTDDISTSIETNKNVEKEIRKQIAFVKKSKAISKKEDTPKKNKNLRKKGITICNFTSIENKNSFYHGCLPISGYFILPNHFNNVTTDNTSLELNSGNGYYFKETNSLLPIKFELQNIIKLEPIRPPPTFFFI